MEILRELAVHCCRTLSRSSKSIPSPRANPVQKSFVCRSPIPGRGRKVDRVLKLTRVQPGIRNGNPTTNCGTIRIKRTLDSGPVTARFRTFSACGARPEKNRSQLEYEGWQAVMYSFFGGDRLEVTDLEGVCSIRGSRRHDCGRRQSGGETQGTADSCAAKLLELPAVWYGRGRSLVTEARGRRRKRGRWPAVVSATSLRPWDKLNLVGAMESLDGYGRSLLGDDAWTRDCEVVWQAAPWRPTWRFHGSPVVPQAVLVGPVHGDLTPTTCCSR